MNFYLDFDYTLFNTYAFRKELYNILEQNGLDKSYLALTLEDREQKLINIREVFKELSEMNNLNIDNFTKPLDELYKKSDRFVYDDVIDFLKYLRMKKHKIYLLTWGEREYQREKLKASKLEEYLDETIFTEKLKYTLDIDYENGIFIDDSIRDLEGLYNRNAKYVFRIKRKDGKNSNKKLNVKEILEFSSLNELKEYLEKVELV